MRQLQLHNEAPELQWLAKAKCSADIVHFVKEWVWTYDPRQAVSSIPFDLFEKQEEALLWLREVEDLQIDALVEKSRDTGLSWLCAAYLVHRWLFRPGFAGGVGSRKALYVDDLGNPNSFFGKIRLIIDRLPRWMLPAGFSMDIHGVKMKIINPETGSYLFGEAGKNIGRGARATVYILDEAAFIEHSATVDAALSHTAQCKIYVSTPNGTNNTFYSRRHKDNAVVFTMHWTDDPRKARWFAYDPSGAQVAQGTGRLTEEERALYARVTYPWYEEQVELLDPVTLAQEVDIDYSASTEGVCIPGRYVQAAIDLWKLVELELTLEGYAGLDVAGEGANKNVLIIRKGVVVKEEWCRSWGKMDLHNSAVEAQSHAERMHVALLNLDGDGLGASVSSTWRNITKPRFRWQGVRGNWRPTQHKWANGRRSTEMFANFRAEMWWSLRERFEKTYEYVRLGIQHPLDELISIPRIKQMVHELPTVTYHKNGQGKYVIESKQDMKDRGVKSPDWADALVYAFAPEVRVESTQAPSGGTVETF